MKEEWKFVSMKHGAQFVITFLNITGTALKQMLFADNLDILELVRIVIKQVPTWSSYISMSIVTVLIQRCPLMVLEEEVYLRI